MLGMSFYDSLTASFQEEHKKLGFSDQECDSAGFDTDKRTPNRWRGTQSGIQAFHQGFTTGLGLQDAPSFAGCGAPLSDLRRHYAVSGAVCSDPLLGVDRQQSGGKVCSAGGCHMGHCNAIMGQKQVQDSSVLSHSIASSWSLICTY